MTPANKAHLLAAQLLARRKEEADILRIEQGLDLLHRKDEMLARMHRELVRIALEHGCTEEFSGAREMVKVVCAALRINAVVVLNRADEVINKAYMGEAA